MRQRRRRPVVLADLSPPATAYGTVRVAVSPEAGEAVANFLGEAGAVGIVEEEGGRAAGLRAFFPPGTDVAEVRARLERYLAVAAARLGVPRVSAIDVDPDAVAAARANAARNAVADRVAVELASVQTWSGPAAGIVLANLLGTALVGLARELARVTARPGCLVAGGLLAEESDRVVAAFAARGLRLAARVDHAEWASLLLEA